LPTELPSNEHAVRSPGSLQLDTHAAGIPTDETVDLIAARKVEGTPIFDRSGERLGEIVAVMLEKRTALVAYVVLGSGGFLGLGETHRALAWKSLVYEPDLGGYLIDDAAMTSGEAAAPEAPEGAAG
jgi:hypothetical protein